MTSRPHKSRYEECCLSSLQSPGGARPRPAAQDTAPRCRRLPAEAPSAKMPTPPTTRGSMGKARARCLSGATQPRRHARSLASPRRASVAPARRRPRGARGAPSGTPPQHATLRRRRLAGGAASAAALGVARGKVSHVPVCHTVCHGALERVEQRRIMAHALQAPLYMATCEDVHTEGGEFATALAAVHALQPLDAPTSACPQANTPRARAAAAAARGAGRPWARGGRR